MILFSVGVNLSLLFWDALEIWQCAHLQICAQIISEHKLSLTTVMDSILVFQKSQLLELEGNWDLFQN